MQADDIHDQLLTNTVYCNQNVKYSDLLSLSEDVTLSFVVYFPYAPRYSVWVQRGRLIDSTAHGHNRRGSHIGLSSRSSARQLKRLIDILLLV